MSPLIGRYDSKVLLKVKDNVIYPEEVYLNEADALEIIKESPCIVPFIESDKCIVMHNVELNRKYDAIVFELSDSGVNAYILYFDYYDYINLMIDEGNEITEIYRSIDPEQIDDDIEWFYSSFTRTRKGKVIEVRKRIKDALNLKRLKFNRVIAVFVVDEITKPVRQLVDIANDDLEAYVAAMSIEKYCWNKDSCLLVSRGYTW